MPVVATFQGGVGRPSRCSSCGAVQLYVGLVRNSHTKCLIGLFSGTCTSMYSHSIWRYPWYGVTPLSGRQKSRSVKFSHVSMFCWPAYRWGSMNALCHNGKEGLFPNFPCVRKMRRRCPPYPCQEHVAKIE